MGFEVGGRYLLALSLVLSLLLVNCSHSLPIQQGVDGDSAEKALEPSPSPTAPDESIPDAGNIFVILEDLPEIALEPVLRPRLTSGDDNGSEERHQVALMGSWSPWTPSPHPDELHDHDDDEEGFDEHDDDASISGDLSDRDDELGDHDDVHDHGDVSRSQHGHGTSYCPVCESGCKHDRDYRSPIIMPIIINNVGSAGHEDCQDCKNGVHGQGYAVQDQASSVEEENRAHGHGLDHERDRLRQIAKAMIQELLSARVQGRGARRLGASHSIHGGLVRRKRSMAGPVPTVNDRVPVFAEIAANVHPAVQAVKSYDGQGDWVSRGRGYARSQQMAQPSRQAPHAGNRHTLQVMKPNVQIYNVDPYTYVPDSEKRLERLLDQEEERDYLAVRGYDPDMDTPVETPVVQMVPQFSRRRHAGDDVRLEIVQEGAGGSFFDCLSGLLPGGSCGGMTLVLVFAVLYFAHYYCKCKYPEEPKPLGGCCDEGGIMGCICSIFMFFYKIGYCIFSDIQSVVCGCGSKKDEDVEEEQAMADPGVSDAPEE